MKNTVHALLSAALCIALAAPAARAERLEEGTVEIGGNLMYDFDTPFGSDLSLDLLGGYHVVYGWLVGGEFQMSHDDYTQTLALSAMLERSFEIGEADSLTPFIPYVGAGVGFARASYEGADDASAVLFSLKGGLKLMLTGDLALDLGLHVNLATDDIYYDGDGPCRTDISIRLGLRTFLF